MWRKKWTLRVTIQPSTEALMIMAENDDEENIDGSTALGNSLDEM